MTTPGKKQYPLNVKRVFLVCDQAHIDFFNRTILRRDLVELRTGRDLDSSFPAIADFRPDLVVIWDVYNGSLEGKLRNFAGSHPCMPVSAVILSNSIHKQGLPPFIRKVMPENVDVFSFNDEIAVLLDFPTRRSARISIRMGISLSQPDDIARARTINISGSGMLVESLKPLSTGKIYQFRFMGIRSDADAQPMQVKVIRRELGNPNVQSLHVYAMEFVGIPAAAMESTLLKIIH